MNFTFTAKPARRVFKLIFCCTAAVVFPFHGSNSFYPSKMSNLNFGDTDGVQHCAYFKSLFFYASRQTVVDIFTDIESNTYAKLSAFTIRPDCEAICSQRWRPTVVNDSTCTWKRSVSTMHACVNRKGQRKYSKNQKSSCF